MTGQRRHDECAGFGRTAIECDVQRVIAVRKVAGQRQVAPREPAAVDFAPLVFPQFLGAHATADFAPTFGGDAPAEFPRERVGRDRECHVLAARMHDCHG